MKQRISVRRHQSGPKQNLIRLTKRHIASGRGEKHRETAKLGVTVKLVLNRERIFPAHHPIQKIAQRRRPLRKFKNESFIKLKQTQERTDVFSLLGAWPR